MYGKPPSVFPVCNRCSVYAKRKTKEAKQQTLFADTLVLNKATTIVIGKTTSVSHFSLDQTQETPDCTQEVVEVSTYVQKDTLHLSLTSCPNQRGSCQPCFVCLRGSHAVRILYHLKSSESQENAVATLIPFILGQLFDVTHCQTLGKMINAYFIMKDLYLLTHLYSAFLMKYWFLLLCSTYQTCDQATLTTLCLDTRVTVCLLLLTICQLSLSFYK